MSATLASSPGLDPVLLGLVSRMQKLDPVLVGHCLEARQPRSDLARPPVRDDGGASDRSGLELGLRPVPDGVGDPAVDVIGIRLCRMVDEMDEELPVPLRAG